MVKLARKKMPKKGKKNKLVKTRKKSFNFKEFYSSLQNLDMQNYGGWPIAVKIFVILLIFVFIGALAYAIPISAKMDQIAAAAAEQQVLLDTYREKESKARHLETYKRQVASMEIEFKELLNQLPKDTRVSELVEGINMTGVGSNIRFKNIIIEDEKEKDLFIEQPIVIEAVGDYHQFGAFISGLAALPRIITLHDFEVSNTRPSLDTIPQLSLTLNTKTYRSKEVVEEVAEPPAKEE